jgi:hypothetical protein
MYLPSCGIIWKYRLADLFDNAPQPFFKGFIVPELEELALAETQNNLTTSPQWLRCKPTLVRGQEPERLNEPLPWNYPPKNLTNSCNPAISWE